MCMTVDQVTELPIQRITDLGSFVPCEWTCSWNDKHVTMKVIVFLLRSCSFKRKHSFLNTRPLHEKIFKTFKDLGWDSEGSDTQVLWTYFLIHGPPVLRDCISVVVVLNLRIPCTIILFKIRTFKMCRVFPLSDDGGGGTHTPVPHKQTLSSSPPRPLVNRQKQNCGTLRSLCREISVRSTGLRLVHNHGKRKDIALIYITIYAQFNLQVTAFKNKESSLCF